MSDLGDTVEELTDQLLGERDVIAVTVINTLAALEGKLEEWGWDRPAALWVMYRELAPPEDLKQAGVAGEIIALLVRELGQDLFDGMGGSEIAWRLRKLAESKWLRALIPDQLFGWVLTNEAWMLQRKPKDPEWDRLDGPISENPERIEIRFLMCVDNAGVCYQLVRRRDNNRVSVYIDGRDGFSAGGELFEAMRELAKLTT